MALTGTSLDIKPVSQSARRTPSIPSPASPVQGTDMSAIFAALAQAMLGQTQNQSDRIGLQRGALFGRHLGMGGGEITDTNPQGYAGGSPFTNGFFNQSFSQLSPEAQMQSQGPTAINQWQALMPRPMMPPVQPNVMNPQPAPQPKRKGSSFGFGASASPRPGFGF